MTSLAESAPVAAPPARECKVSALKLVVSLIAGALLFGEIAGQLVQSGKSTDVVGLALVLLPVALWKRPHLAPVVLLAAALLVEQFGQGVEPTGVNAPGTGDVVLTANIPITSHIPLFRGLGSLHLEPADLMLVTVAIIYLAKSADWEARWRGRSHLARAVFGLTGAVALGILVGLSHHGDLRVALMEARPYVYLAATFVLTASLVRNRSALRTALWIIVVATGVKALQGLYVFVKVRNMHPRPESVLGHEEAYFFGIFFFLVAALWLFGVRGRLRNTATWLLPVVIGADLANNRRAAWLLLAAGLVALAAVAYRALPARRRALGGAAVISLAVCAVYLPAYWNKTGGLAQPARALRSMISPDPRDASSDLYRNQENANLKLNIKEGGVIGRGFGVPIDYKLPIADIKSIDPLIAYVPHNGVLYILMRMGVLGGIALWCLLAIGIVAGARLAQSSDKEIAVVGALVVCALVAYALEGATDQGFFFYRIAFVTGSLLGLAEGARQMLRTAAPARARIATPISDLRTFVVARKSF
jgi:hypothetical protein